VSGDFGVPLIIDTSLRDGLQAPGLFLSRKGASAFIRDLSDSGLRAFEIGVPAASPEEAGWIGEMVREWPGLRLIAWNRGKKEDIEASLATGIGWVHFSLPVSDLMRETKLGWTREKLISVCRDLCARVKDAGRILSVGMEDASRADLGFLADFAAMARTAGADMVRYADTLGCEDPWTVQHRLGALVPFVGAPIEYHAHNDLGLATANALSALRSGAASASATVMGIGERAGNAALEQLAAAIELRLHRSTGLDLAKLCEAARRFAERLEMAIDPFSPVLGENAFRHSSGIHADGSLKRRGLYSYLDPGRFGRREMIVPGPKSGRAAIIYCAASLGKEIDPASAGRVLSRLSLHWEEEGPGIDPWEALSRSIEAEEGKT
jgi:homocitrate synthase NifV